MSDEDQSTRVGLWLVGLVVSAVVIGTVVYSAGAGTTRGSTAQVDGMAPGAEPSAASAAEAPAPSLQLVSAVYFASAASAIDPDGAQAIEKAAHAASADPNTAVVLSGYHDASGNAERNAELAKQRALAVRDALVAAGVKVERIQLRKPQVLVGGGDAKEARRVDIGLAAQY